MDLISRLFARHRANHDGADGVHKTACRLHWPADLLIPRLLPYRVALGIFRSHWDASEKADNQ